MPEKTSIKLPIIFAIVAVLLLIPAFFINLGLISFIEEEGTQGIIAFEMLKSGDYLVARINGEYFYDNLPLLNWIETLVFQLSGRNSNFIFRLPIVIFTMLFGLAIFLFFRKRFGVYFAFVIALASVTCGRLFYYDSLHGLANIPFALFSFVLFVSIYEFYEKKQFYHLFIIAYLISSVSFLLIGLPAILFQITALLTLFIFKKNFKLLFSLQHLLGFVLFVFIVGGFSFVYELKDPGHVKTFFEFYFLGEAKDYLAEITVKNILAHFLLFPLHYIIDFLPATLFFVFLFKKGAFKEIYKEEYNRFILLIVLINTLLFWIIPGNQTSNLLVLIPMLFAFFLYPFLKDITEKDWRYKSMELIIYGMLVLTILVPFSFFVFPQTKEIHDIYFKISFLTFFALMIFYVFYHQRKFKLFTFFLAFVVVRIAFNWFVLPNQYEESWQVKAEKDAIRLGEKYADKELFIVDLPTKNNETQRLLTDLSLFYLSKERGEILKLDSNLKKGALYLMDIDDVDYRKHRVVDELFMNNNQVLYLVELR